jgi:hypothetical protein
VSQGSENGIEWTLRKLVSNNLPDEKLWESVSQMLEELKAQPKVMQYSFCNTVIDVLWSLGLRGRAAQVLSLARENQVYNHEFCIYSTTEWCLDLHRWALKNSFWRHADCHLIEFLKSFRFHKSLLCI